MKRTKVTVTEGRERRELCVISVPVFDHTTEAVQCLGEKEALRAINQYLRTKHMNEARRRSRRGTQQVKYADFLSRTEPQK